MQVTHSPFPSVIRSAPGRSQPASETQMFRPSVSSSALTRPRPESERRTGDMDSPPRNRMRMDASTSRPTVYVSLFSIYAANHIPTSLHSRKSWTHQKRHSPVSLPWVAHYLPLAHQRAEGRGRVRLPVGRRSGQQSASLHQEVQRSAECLTPSFMYMLGLINLHSFLD